MERVEVREGREREEEEDGGGGMGGGREGWEGERERN